MEVHIGNIFGLRDHTVSHNNTIFYFSRKFGPQINYSYTFAYNLGYVYGTRRTREGSAFEGEGYRMISESYISTDSKKKKRNYRKGI